MSDRNPTKSDRVKDAAATVRHHLRDTPISPDDFTVRPISGTSYMGEYQRLEQNAVIPRAWAYGKGRMKLVGAIDKLVKLLEL